MLLHLSPQDKDSLMQDLQELMRSFTGPDCHVTPKVTWAEWQALCAQKGERQWWTACSLLKVLCWDSVSIATVRMLLCSADCLPRHILCATCDKATHSTKVLHNRESLFEGIYRPLSPNHPLPSRRKLCVYCLCVSN
ncbi:unnamed protein product [Oncorhynchus mykiss]|uniref:Uncharacterized protein n=1 Tax=Oncorhynchus mykiss TaxID=8022 RepID=A0A060XLU4_ONCMY|nr:unnamed protein product [Oncorhynchus mykiss]